MLGSLPNESVLLVEHDLEGLPPVDGGYFLKEGRVTRTWNDGTARSMMTLARVFESGGGPPPPLAALAAMLSEKHGRTPAVARLEPAAFNAALEASGWRVGSVPPRAGATPGNGVIVCEQLTHMYPEGRD